MLLAAVVPFLLPPTLLLHLLLVPLQPQDKQFSTASQKCTLIATAVGKTFHSTSPFPCNFRPMPTASMGKGCCYDPLGLKHRRLMSAEVLEAYTQAALRRMM
jgi:hypothetical protein